MGDALLCRHNQRVVPRRPIAKVRSDGREGGIGSLPHVEETRMRRARDRRGEVLIRLAEQPEAIHTLKSYAYDERWADLALDRERCHPDFRILDRRGNGANAAKRRFDTLRERREAGCAWTVRKCREYSASWAIRCRTKFRRVRAAIRKESALSARSV